MDVLFRRRRFNKRSATRRDHQDAGANALAIEPAPEQPVRHALAMPLAPRAPDCEEMMTRMRKRLTEGGTAFWKRR
jgi:hypothetical protein